MTAQLNYVLAQEKIADLQRVGSKERLARSARGARVRSQGMSPTRWPLPRPLLGAGASAGSIAPLAHSSHQP